MQVRSLGAEAGEIDLVRSQRRTDCLFDSKDYVHQLASLIYGQIAHFLHVGIPDHAAKTRIVGISDLHDAAATVSPQQFAAIRFT